MKSLKKALSIVLYVLIILVFLVAVVFVMAAINQSKTGVSGAFGYTFDVVQTKSMEPGIMVGDIVVGKAVDVDTTEIKVDDIVTYNTTIQGVESTITHRVYEIEYDGSMYLYKTWGDNREVAPVPDDGERNIYDIVSFYREGEIGFVIPKLGLAIDFLKTPLGFIICVVLPLLAFIVWEVIDLVKIYNRVKKESFVAEAATGASDDVKDAIIREYLAKQAAEAAAKGEQSSGDASDNNQK